MLTLLGINKILAVYVGPSGYAAIGQFQNAVQIISTLASGAINNGVTKYTAEYHQDAALQRTVWQTAGTIALGGSAVLSCLVFILRADLAQWFLNDASLAPVFGWLAPSLVLFVFNTLLLAILNGKKAIRLFVFANVAGSAFSIVVTSLMVVSWGLLGALVALAVYQSLTFFVTFTLCIKTDWFRWNYLIGSMNKDILMKLAKYSAMALTTASMVPLSHIMIRNYLGQELGWERAGYWEAISRLSSAYLMLVTTTLSVYYLPRLSELKTSAEIKEEIFAGYRVILPAVVACSVLMYSMRYAIIEILFSAQFLPVAELFLWQLIGDVFKVASWLIAFVMLGKSMVSIYILTEIIFSLSFFGLAVIIVNLSGLVGVSMAYAFNYALYFIVIAVLIGSRLRMQNI